MRLWRFIVLGAFATVIVTSGPLSVANAKTPAGSYDSGIYGNSTYDPSADESPLESPTYDPGGGDSPEAVPEPGSLLLLSLGLAAAGGAGRLAKKRARSK